MNSPKLVIVTGTSVSARETVGAYLEAFPDAKIVEEQPDVWSKLFKFIRVRFRKRGLLSLIDALALRLVVAFREQGLRAASSYRPNLIVTSVNDPELVAFVSEHKPDIVVLNICSLLSGNQIEALNIPIINVHNGITPRYRGSGNIWALAEDNSGMVGVTVHRVDAGIDTGERLSIERFDPISEKIPFNSIDREAFRRGAQLAIGYITRGARSMPSDAMSTVNRYYAYPGLTTWLAARRLFTRRTQVAAAGQSIEKIWQSSFSELAGDESRSLPQRFHWSDDKSVMWRDRAVHEIIAAISSTNDRLLDIGCGDGRLATSLNLQYFGCDFSEPSLNLSGPSLRRVCASASALPFQSKSFNICIAIGLFQHLDHAQNVADEMLRIATSEGLIVINTLRQFSKVELLIIILGSILNRRQRLLALAIWRHQYGPNLCGEMVARRYKVGQIAGMFPNESTIRSITYHGPFGYRFFAREFTIAIQTPRLLEPSYRG